jgi:hypothetical protein
MLVRFCHEFVSLAVSNCGGVRMTMSKTEASKTFILSPAATVSASGAKS